MSANQEMVAAQVAAEPRSGWRHATLAVYGLCVAAGIAVWFPAIGAPLWLDETWFYWSIAKGFGEIRMRQDPLSFPAGSYVLWLATKLVGTSEIAMRVPSVLAMLGSAWLLYLAAREMFERDVALIAVVVFCLDPVVVFAATDVGVYGYAVLMTSAAILLALRARRSGSIRMAVLAGLAAALAVWFHYLFAVLTVALAVCLLMGRQDTRAKWSQVGAAEGGFVLGFLPVIPGVLNMFRTRGEHVYMPPPSWMDLVVTVAPGVGWVAVVLVASLAVGWLAAVDRSAGKVVDWAGRDGLTCAALGLIPLGILWGVSALTPLHMSAPPWHLLSAMPGIALCWAWLARGLRREWLRVVFCLLVMWAGVNQAQTAITVARLPSEGKAITAAEKNAARDRAPVVFCSDFVESDHSPMPVGRARDSKLFAALAYYRLTAPVVPLPKELNAEAMRVGGDFVEQAAARHMRFLAMGHEPSYPVLDWLEKRASGEYSVRILGKYSDVKVMEFTPRAQAVAREGEKR